MANLLRAAWSTQSTRGGGTEPRCATSRGLPARHGIKRVERRLRCGPERREPSGCTHGDGSVVGSAQGSRSRGYRLLRGADNGRVVGSAQGGNSPSYRLL